jgi:hypothetical protein
MPNDRPNHAERQTGKPEPHLSVEEVVTRLDKLWTEPPAEAAPLLDLSGQRIGSYRIEQPVGCGAFGIVYRARDEQLDRDVALKVPRPEVLLDAEKLGRFESEAATAATLDHPSIVPVYTADLTGPTPFIASAYCAGPDLGEWLAKQAVPLEPEQAARFMIKVADAMHYAHGQGVLHRDLKPSNILLEPKRGGLKGGLDDFEPKVTDFGLAKLVESNLQDTHSSVLIGTPLYMAPEQLAPEIQDSSSCSADVYALGVLLFELLTFQTPFEAASYIEVVDRLRNEEAPRLRSVRPDLPADVQTICAKCLEKNPNDRYASAQALADELRRFVAGKPIEARSYRGRDQFVRWCRRPERIAAAGRYTFYYQLSIIVWMLLNLGTVYVLELVSEEDLRRSTRDIVLVTFAVHLPKMWLARLLVRGRRWAFWLSAISSMLLLGIFVQGAMGQVLAFDYNYPTALSKVSVFSLLIVGCLLETGLHLLALPAWLRRRKRSA